MFFGTLKKIFQRPIYAFLSLITSFGAFAFAVWLPNIRLIISFMGHSEIPFSQKINLPISLLGSITTNFTLLSASYTIAIAVLFGINLSMIVYYLEKRITELKHNGITTGFFGIMSGIFGIGCATCGSVILTGVLSLFGSSWILSFLPLRGGEFGILGVILLAISICITANQIQNPAVCKI
ncbi:MAG: hypothetical protein HY005_01590 [Candidatus Staskawiczbacteria bacterium]|nr:hypothetical protein [Candidatus Staskawiczbacteria bacterium]